MKSVQESVKDDPETTKKILQAAEIYQVNSGNLTELLNLLRSSNITSLSSSVESCQTSITALQKDVTDQAASATNVAWTLGSRLTALEGTQATIEAKVSMIQ